MKFKARIEVRLRKDGTDPESETIKESLLDLGFKVSQAKVAKIYEITLEAGTRKDAESIVKSMCTRLLVNPSKDEFKVEVEPLGSRA
ncbi:MAG TPA: phosphoribosylformylglycinamidine synthase subunit PurS [Nitrososphaerales archaeon]|nr:phosphoribosylformylglycinamidine synthase subunit PurS [Nitrososphaerales archaeon]